MIDFSKIQKSSTASSNKVYMQDSGSFNVAALAGAGETFSSAVIPHKFGSDALIAQVTTTIAGAENVVLPWESNDGRIIQYTAIDTTSLYIYCISSDLSGFGNPAFTVYYFYRLLVP